ncbi:hypothetical protein LPJ67_006999, partial [Coemansia sp. RSA 1938]
MQITQLGVASYVEMFKARECAQWTYVAYVVVCELEDANMSEQQWARDIRASAPSMRQRVSPCGVCDTTHVRPAYVRRVVYAYLV